LRRGAKGPTAARQTGVIEVDKISKQFRDKTRGLIRAVDGVSFCCEPGRVYGLLGANGAGKTTTLRMLATILVPTGGTARVAGCDIRQEAEKVRSRIGFLSTATALYGRLTAQEMVEYFGRLYGLDEEALRQRVHAIFGRLEMNGFRDRRCDNLSTGMKQKVSIARTMVHDPAVMIFDEPTLGLDVMTARAITQFIRECREQGKTVLFSTHVMSEAAKMCDTIGIIHNWRLVAEGTLGELRERYRKDDLEEIFIQVVQA
jgi:sodium transport system ATP-binding protein